MRTAWISVALLGIVSLFKAADATVVFTTPSGGDGTYAENENNGANEAVVTVVATVGSNPGDYSLASASSSSPFSVAANGDVSIANANALDHETTASYVIYVERSDDDGTVSATLTITVTDVNETPAYSASTFVSSCLTSPVASGTTVYTVTATDPDDGDTITYSKDAGLTNAALDVTAANVITQSEITSYQAILVEASDGTLAATATVLIRVGGCSTAAAVSVSVLTILSALLVSMN